MTTETSSNLITAKEQLEAYFHENGLDFTTVEHEAVFTVDALMAISDRMPGWHHKHLFLKNKKGGQLYLVVARHDATVDLKAVAAALGVGGGNIRFASDDVLFETLGVRQGAVTLFALVNDVEAQKVKLIMDRKIMECSDADNTQLWWHPMVNTATSGITAQTLKRLLMLLKHEPLIMDF